jgi:BRCA1-associated protein
MSRKPPLYSIVIALNDQNASTAEGDYREGDICIDWVDYHSEKDVAGQSLSPDGLAQKERSPVPGRRPLSRSPGSENAPGVAYPVQRQTQGTTELGPGVIHLFKHDQPLSLLQSLEADMTSKSKGEKEITNHQSKSGQAILSKAVTVDAEGQDGTLIAILAVPIWMDVANLAGWLGAFTVCLEGYRMIR